MSDSVAARRPSRTGRFGASRRRSTSSSSCWPGSRSSSSSIFPPALLVNDSWLNLMAGTRGRSRTACRARRADDLRPRRDLDRPAVARAGLHVRRLQPRWLRAPLDRHVRVVVGAFALAAAASRSLGAGPRAIWLLFLPVLISAALGWSIRAQMLTLPLYTGLLWLLASQARRPTNRVWIALPMLVALGEHARERRTRRAARRCSSARTSSCAAAADRGCEASR